MTKPQTRQTHLLFAALIALVALLVLGAQAQADYSYDFHFDALTFNNITYPADGFSFTSPALIGPGTTIIPGSPFIESLTLSSPLELNGFSFSTIRWGTASFHLPASVETMFALGFQGPDPVDFTLPPGAIGDFFAGIGFPEGTYGPGFYTSDQFGRAIKGDVGFVYGYTTGSLSISEVFVPAPATILLLGPGLAGLWFYRRRRG
jgi:hypothetical protein